MLSPSYCRFFSVKNFRSPRHHVLKHNSRKPGQEENNSSVRVLWEPFRKVLPGHELTWNEAAHSEAEATSAAPAQHGEMEHEGVGAAARFWGVSPADMYDRVADTVTPLWKLSYSRQLMVKQARQEALLRQLGRQLRHLQPQLKPPAAAPRGLPCPLDNILPSPQTEGYRNKEEYKIAEGVDGDPKTVGFVYGSPSKGPLLCLPGDRLLNVKPRHALVAKEFQQFVRTSPVRACSRLDDGGSWRLLLVRSNQADDLLVSVTFHPQQLTTDQIHRERDRMREYFSSSGPGAHCQIQSLFFQQCRHMRCTSEQAPYELLFGPGPLRERLDGLQFLLSPDSFFQVNPLAALSLYRTVRRLARPTPRTVLLDIGCGAGPISLLMAPHCRVCVGFESAASAVRDARENAHLNNINNVEFLHGRVEKMLLGVVGDLEMCTDMVAVINPGRDGLPPAVIRLLRATPALRRVVYIACKPDHPRTASNLLHLCRPSDQFRPFRPVQATPIDLFPHTDHCELVMTFER